MQPNKMFSPKLGVLTAMDLAVQESVRRADAINAVVRAKQHIRSEEFFTPFEASVAHRIFELLENLVKGPVTKAPDTSFKVPETKVEEKSLKSVEDELFGESNPAAE